MTDITDLVAAVVNKDPLAFSDAFGDIMSQKALASLDDTRLEVARSIYGTSAEVDGADDDQDV